MLMNIFKWLKMFSPSYRLAQDKRGFESFLKSQGYNRTEAREAAFKKYSEGGGLR